MIDLSRFGLFEGLTGVELEDVHQRLQQHSLSEGEPLCRKGEPGASMWLIESGLLEVRLPGVSTSIALLRRNDCVGEASLLTAEPRSADVVAVIPSRVLELDQGTFASVAGRHPQILRNVIRMLLDRQARHNIRISSHGKRGEAVALVVGESGWSKAPAVVAATENLLGDAVHVGDLTERLELSRRTRRPSDAAALLSQLDALLADHRCVITVAEPATPGLPETLLQSDRVVLLMSVGEARALLVQPSLRHSAVELAAADRTQPTADLPGVRVLSSSGDGSVDAGWLARHLTRTKLGLALGAGGAKGFAHVGAIRAIREVGWAFDYVTGASIGAIVGAGVALGMDDDELDAFTNHMLSYDVCGSYFRLNKELPLEQGLQLFFDALAAAAGGRKIEDLHTPFALMTADLNSREPFLFERGPLTEALCAALSIPGLAPPYPYEGRRLVDGVTISPVPSQAARDLGADIVVSVNLMCRSDLAEWPPDENGQRPPIKPSKPIDPVVETVIMLQTDASIRHAADADIVITPVFGPSSWRDIDYAPLFRRAGRLAAQAALPRLRALARPA
jgi:predicted acylesterase/phospholipase RssA